MSTEMPDRVVVVGSSVGGIRAAQGLRAQGLTGQVVVVGSEKAAPYDKPPLSKQLLSGEWNLEDIALVSVEELQDAGIELRLGVAARGVDVANRTLALADGTTLAYDALVIATGVRPRTLSAPRTVPLHTVRELADVSALRAALDSGGGLVVVGGGFIGAEIASTAAGLGVPTSIVEALPAPFSRVLGDEVGGILARLHAENDVEVVSGTGVVALRRGPTGLTEVELGDGRVLSAGAVAVGIGCVPNTEWLAGSGIPVSDGVSTDEFSRVLDVPGVYAIGDVAHWHDVRTGTSRRVEHWTHAFQQAQLVAHNLVHPDDLQAQTRAPYFWSDQHGVKIQMVGRRGPADAVDVVWRDSPGGPRPVALYSDSGRFTGGVTFGAPQVSVRLRRAWEDGVTLTEARALVVGPSEVLPADARMGAPAQP
ncbi:FAD/NAD(P)-binding oxidoreductase [Nocardioides sp.]|uniref:NAD(P)/FAD-dependent oxidoreductase n=1 Tax=Nocardioides sp. TaxID=35761 RepID=UPI00260AB692|nr:FAD/NAD(P)-binding oxidoreductase [Nocardioides sp.]MDI6909352.1 FAD/NAD(P)-binding oxidoreductase [Nocardioides sp.]